MEMCRWLCQGFTEIQNGRHRSTLIFWWRKNSKTLSRKLFKFNYHIPHNMEMCKWFVKVLLKFKMAAMDKLHIFCGRKTEKLKSVIIHIFFFGGGTQKICLVNFFSNFNITFLATWGCASDFLKMLPNFKMTARGQLQNFCGRKNSKTRSQKLFKFYYHIPHDMEMCRWLF